MGFRKELKVYQYQTTLVKKCFVSAVKIKFLIIVVQLEDEVQLNVLKRLLLGLLLNHVILNVM